MASLLRIFTSFEELASPSLAYLIAGDYYTHHDKDDPKGTPVIVRVRNGYPL